ncbi:substrate-binding domain-containing protein [Azohydromonas aeria]|uniref:substrate-binding domain-containing protein n=1 Tax=Azohydromonas aeria TaxID=2590212 RepID=UPI0012FA6C34|nr:substrate-binding domain-containing protein [Azohydromonas aeria]
MPTPAPAPSRHACLPFICSRLLCAAFGAAAAGAWAQASAPAAGAAPAALSVHAAGSLRAALTDAAQAFERQSGTKVALTFGASGLLKDRLVAGEHADVFASANLEHPQALVAAGKAGSVAAFARNALCLLGGPGFALQGQDVAQRLLDPALRIGVPTPGADPAGDYAVRFFDRIESSGAAGPGSAAQLKARALQLAGGPDSPEAPPGRSPYAMLLAEGRADVFITYCSNATLAVRENPALQTYPLPQRLEVSAVYGLVLLQPTTPAAERFAAFLRGPEGQAVLRGHGFRAP